MDRPEAARAQRSRRSPGRGRRARAGSPASPAAASLEVSAEAIAINLEAVLWLALVGVALALRLASLDHLPVTANEGARAFNAWLVSKGDVPEGWSGDLTAALTSYIFRIFGSGEVGARLVPALSGSALVVSMWFARPYFGRGAALLAGTFIALSPLAVGSSRSAFSFAPGALLSMLMVLALLAYLERPRQLPAIVLAAAFGLALGSDPIATSTAVALAAFVLVEFAWRRRGAVDGAVSAFRTTADHWRPAAIALALTLTLGVGQFGTDIDRLSLAGLRQWADVFALPGDGLPRLYQLYLLVGYEWPLLLAGGAGYLLLVRRRATASGPVPLSQRLLVVWATVALLVVVFATRREADQVLLLLLPLAFLAASFIEEAASGVEWGLLKRRWPALALALVLVAYALLQTSRWARLDAGISTDERTLLVLALTGAAAITAGGFYYWGRNGLIVALPAATALALPFLIHSSLSLGFGEGTEYAVPRRFLPRIEQFAAAVGQQSAGSSAFVAVEGPLGEALAWYLRDSQVVLDGAPTGSVIVTEPGRQVPQGFTTLGGPWRLAEGWVPANFDLLPAWRWLAERRPYGNLSTLEVQILVSEEQ